MSMMGVGVCGLMSMMSVCGLIDEQDQRRKEGMSMMSVGGWIDKHDECRFMWMEYLGMLLLVYSDCYDDDDDDDDNNTYQCGRSWSEHS